MSEATISAASSYRAATRRGAFFPRTYGWTPWTPWTPWLSVPIRVDKDEVGSLLAGGATILNDANLWGVNLSDTSLTQPQIKSAIRDRIEIRNDI